MSYVTEFGNDTVTVFYEASRYIPAQTFGPPESCYPAEGGEIEVVLVEYETNGRALINGKWVKVDKMIADITCLMSDADIERFQEEIAALPDVGLEEAA